MSRELLERAQSLIISEDYDEARNILEGLKDMSSTARKWLENLNVLEAERLAQSEPAAPPPSAAPRPISEDVDEATVDFVDDEDTIEMSAVSHDDEPPISVDSSMNLRGDYISPDEAPTVVVPQTEMAASGSTTVRWEYREIVLRTWHQHMSNIEYALEQGGEKITIEDAYTRLLNENGAQGWEVVSEEVLPQQYVRLLMKRPVSE